jgi:putative FmdB family regulatory protein
MPIYEFQCTNSACKNIEEHLLRHSDPLPNACEKCESPLEKLVSQTSFALKGSGWYVTDYKGSNAGSASSTTNSTDSAPNSGTSETSSPTNTAPAAEAATCGAPACGTSACAAN